MNNNDENCLHYDEVSKYYPIEFEQLFARYARKKARSEAGQSMRQIVIADLEGSNNLDHQRTLASGLNNQYDPSRGMSNQEAFAYIMSQRHGGQHHQEDLQVRVAPDPDAIEASRRIQQSDSQNRMLVLSGESQNANDQSRVQFESQHRFVSTVDPEEILRLSTSIARESIDIPITLNSSQPSSSFNTMKRGQGPNFSSQPRLGVLDEKNEEEEDDDQVRMGGNNENQTEEHKMEDLFIREEDPNEQDQRRDVFDPYMEEEEKDGEEFVGRYGHPKKHLNPVSEDEERKTAIGGTNMNTIHFGENAVIPYSLVDQSQGGSALDGSYPLMTAVSPAVNFHNLSLGKPQLGKDSIDN